MFSNLFNIAIDGGILQEAKDLAVLLIIGQISTATGPSLFGDFLNMNILDPTTQFENIRIMMENIAGSLTNLYCPLFLPRQHIF
jgi:hypothetical protein